jgi:mannobiose 2-epimerase
VQTDLKNLKTELKLELQSILSYWMENTIDTKKGGFVGQIDYSNNTNNEAEKGSVLNARLLWTFSAAYKISNNKEHLDIAKRAFEYISEHFYDKEFGGVFWSINYDGTPKDTKNQIYALAFAIYGLSEYYSVTKDEKALEMAIALYQKIQKYSYDASKGGYLEAFTRNWQPIEDLRLSEKDANEKKTMNTHLHIVEVLETIEKYFINTETGHLRLFFDENWVEKKDVVSYGHDIEAAWLLLQCAEISGDSTLIANYKKHAIQIADVTKEGIDTDGGLWYEYDPETKELMAEKHWWPQAELMIGYFTAWQLSGKQEYLDTVFKNWDFTKKHIIDKENGEWFWGVYSDYSTMEKDKAGFWKCPYHNGRACIELIHRI